MIVVHNGKKINFNNYDAVVVATGNATVNQFLMRFFKKTIPGKPVLFSWLDPYGIGGHCLVSNISENGCYQCFYTNESLHNDSTKVQIINLLPLSKSFQIFTNLNNWSITSFDLGLMLYI